MEKKFMIIGLVLGILVSGPIVYSAPAFAEDNCEYDRDKNNYKIHSSELVQMFKEAYATDENGDSSDYDSGYTDGYDDGYADGYADGLADQ